MVNFSMSRKLSKNIFKVGLVQMTSGDNIADNIKQADTLIREAAARGAAFILTPEMTTLFDIGAKQMLNHIKSEDDDPSLSHFKALAAELDIWLLIGSMAVCRGQKAANRSFLISPAGSKVVSYDKIHMFDVDLSGEEKYRESNTYEAGDQAVIADVPWGKVGLSICYDVRFPHLYRMLAQAGAEILTVPAAFTYMTGKDHWHTLLKARAIENTAFVFAPAQVGNHSNGRKTFGHSLIIDPWGHILGDGGTKIGVIVAEIDMTAVKRARKQIASLRHDKNILLSSS